MAKDITKKTRKTPQQLAEERLGVATRAVESLEKKRDKAQTDLNDATGALAAAVARRDYLALDPALPKQDDDDVVDAYIVEPCPECASGKHVNCTGEVPANEAGDVFTVCPCAEGGHA